MRKSFQIMWIFLCLSGVGLAQVTRYVALDGTNDAFGGFTNWSGAATNIKAAVDLANANNAGDTVWISSGLYALSATVIVSNAIVKGFGTQAEDVVVNAGGARRCFVLRHANAELNNLTLSNGYHTGSFPTDYGAALQVSTGRVFSSIIGWSSNNNFGGGVGVDGPGLLSNCTIIANTAGIRSGGAIAMSTNCDAALIVDCRVIGNYALNGALGNGGGIMVLKGVVERCAIYSNSCGSYGGGVSFSWNTLVDGGSGILKDSTIAGNSAYNGGGASVLSALSCLVYNCIIESNSAPAHYGGGLYLNGPAVTISNSILRGNVALNGSGAWMQGGATMRSCLITGQTQGIGVVYLQHTSTVENCTITGNTNATAALYFVVANDQFARNCIVYDNYNVALARRDVSGAAGYTNCFYYSCAGNVTLPAEQGNINSDPLWGEAATGNYRLRQNSPCVNTGTNLPWVAGALDLDGRLRQDRFSRKTDMGAYEFVPNGMLFMLK